MVRQPGLALCLALLAGCPSFPNPVRPALEGGGPDAGQLDSQGPLNQLVPDRPLPDAPPVLPDAPLVPDATQGLLQGAPCSANGHCKSGFCVDFVCCDTACQGLCKACDLAASKGTCALVLADEDPHHDCVAAPVVSCGDDGLCDGKGACRKFAAGTICAASCSGGKLTGLKLCDGLGACQSKPDVSCLPFDCDSNTDTCYASCTDFNEKTNCYGYYGCDGKKHTCYSSCTKSDQCNSDGHCDKGKCVELD